MATLEYDPRGRGFEVRLAAGSLELVARGTGLHDGIRRFPAARN